MTATIPVVSPLILGWEKVSDPVSVLNTAISIVEQDFPKILAGDLTLGSFLCDLFEAIGNTHLPQTRWNKNPDIPIITQASVWDACTWQLLLLLNSLDSNELATVLCQDCAFEKILSIASSHSDPNAQDNGGSDYEREFLIKAEHAIKSLSDRPRDLAELILKNYHCILDMAGYYPELHHMQFLSVIYDSIRKIMADSIQKLEQRKSQNQELAEMFAEFRYVVEQHCPTLAEGAVVRNRYDDLKMIRDVLGDRLYARPQPGGQREDHQRGPYPEPT